MQLYSADIDFEKTNSPEQDLTFSYISDKFKAMKIPFDESKYKTLHFINRLEKYTYTAFLFSDQNNIVIKCGVYKGKERLEFKSKKEFEGSLLKQVDNIMDYFNILNDIAIPFDGSLQRNEIPNYPKESLREALLNAVIHRDYMSHSDVKLEFFEDRFEVTSAGSLVKGVALDEVLTGTSKLRNSAIANVFHKLEYVETYGTGFEKIFGGYEKYDFKPQVIPMTNFFRVVMPDIKYKKNIDKSDKLELTEIQKEIIEVLKNDNTLTQEKVAYKIKKSARTTANEFKILQDKKIIKKVGSKKIRYYDILI